MYIRMVFMKLTEGKMDEFREIYTSEIIPTVGKHKGNRYAHLLECREDENDCISVTAWDTRGDFEAYIKSGDFDKSSRTYSPMYAKEPIEKSYEVTASSEPLILRIF